MHRERFLHILSYILVYNMCYTWVPERGICGHEGATPTAVVNDIYEENSIKKKQKKNISRSREMI